MTFIELIICIAVGIGIFSALKPLQRRLEFRILRWFSRGRKSEDRPIIDITDRKKRP